MWTVRKAADQARLRRHQGAARVSRRVGTVDAERALGEPARARRQLAANIPDRTDLAFLARRGIVRADRARRVHVFARRGRALLSADAAGLPRRRRVDTA